MGAVKRDLEERVSDKADEIAEQRYGLGFSDIPQLLQHDVWFKAESIVKDELTDQADANYDRMREEGLNHRRCPKCGNEKLVKAIDYPHAPFVGGYRVHRENRTLGDWFICRSLSCEDGRKNDYSIRTSLDADEDEEVGG